MNRSSGMVIFSSAYAICIIVITCCLHIKHDVQGLHHDELVSPAVNHFDTPSEPIRYVLMNPIKPDYPVRLAQRNQEPNILMATLPTEDKLASEQPQRTSRKLSMAAAEKLVSHTFDSSLSDVHSFATQKRAAKAVRAVAKLDTPDLLAPHNSISKAKRAPQVDPQLNLSPFSLASSVSSGKPLTAERFKKMSHENLTPVEPHIVIANDHEAFSQLKLSVKFLSEIGYDSLLLESFSNHLDELSVNGSLDAGNCEATLYRFLVDVEQLKSLPNPEDSRLIESVRLQMIEQINEWIDQLNGVEQSEPELNNGLEINYEKWNTALRIAIWQDLF